MALCCTLFLQPIGGGFGHQMVMIQMNCTENIIYYYLLLQLLFAIFEPKSLETTQKPQKNVSYKCVLKFDLASVAGCSA